LPLLIVELWVIPVAAKGAVHFDALVFDHDKVSVDALDLDNKLLLGDGSCLRLLD